MANIILESARGIQPVAIEDELLRSRMVFLDGEVTGESCAQIIRQLMYLEKEDSTSGITFCINSPGGSVQDGLALYDVLMLLKSPVRTVCTGTCASMGAILFLAGTKREMMTHGKIMIHDPAFGGRHDMGGKKPHEIQTELDDLNRCREALAMIIAKRTGKTLEEIYEVTAEDTYYTAEEAVDFGLATGIVRKKGYFA
ncbi:MAG: ATP-dependent Clp protease proteolytic subunit [Lachnospiraceae bacterium]|nr:ATP-dependent Clp protease proteolytic subunit [Lachnospiraceae bacterium]